MKALDRFIALSAALAVSSLAFAGCNTIEGAGKDIKSAGKAIEEEAAD